MIERVPMEEIEFNILAKPIGPICNMDCKYCFYTGKEALYSGVTDWVMHKDVLQVFIKRYIRETFGPVVNFAWQGGEPTLLGIDYFRQVVALQKKFAAGKTIRNAFQTNGILIDDEWAAFLKENEFLVGISIDGPERLHDAYRVDKYGKPTFSRVMNGVQTLKAHNVEFNTLTAVHKANEAFGIEVYNFLKAIGSKFMQFIPIVEQVSEAGSDKIDPLYAGHGSNGRTTSWSVNPLRFGEFLCAIFGVWVREDVGSYFVQIFDLALAAWSGMSPGLCVFEKQCGQSLIIEHNGDVYSCDHFVYPDNKLGNIMLNSFYQMGTSHKQRMFGAKKQLMLPAYCGKCDVRFVCNGECPKHRFAMAPDGRISLSYLCPGYKRFFHHIAPYMEFMAKELSRGRAPANVMEWVRHME